MTSSAVSSGHIYNDNRLCPQRSLVLVLSRECGGHMDRMHTWSPMSNSGYLAKTHKFTPHELPGVRDAQYTDKLRLLTIYQKEFPKLHKRRRPVTAPKIESRQLIASKWQTPRTRDKNGQVRLVTRQNQKDPTDTERVLYSGRVPEHLLPAVPETVHFNFGRGYISHCQVL